MKATEVARAVVLLTAGAAAPLLLAALAWLVHDYRCWLHERTGGAR